MNLPCVYHELACRSRSRADFVIVAARQQILFKEVPHRARNDFREDLRAKTRRQNDKD